ncbi:unnamed protein product, partial [Rotaria socialis]
MTTTSATSTAQTPR